MAKLINPKTGEAIETEDQHVSAWVKEGFEPAVLMKDTSGTKAYVPASQAKDLLTQKQATPVGERQVNKTSKVESGLRGAAQGVSLGFSDELTGAYDAVAKGLFGDKTMGDAYTQGRDEARANNAKAQASNPGTYATGTMLGAVAPTVVAGLATGGAAAPIAMGAAVRAGAVGGALNGLGTSDASSVGDMALDTVKGAGLGAATAGTLKGAANIVGAGAKVSGMADKAAENSSVARGVKNIYEGVRDNVKTAVKGENLERNMMAEGIGTALGMPGGATAARLAAGPVIKNMKEFAGPAATVLRPFKKIDQVLDSARKAGDLRQGTSNAVANYTLQQTDPSYRKAVDDENEVYSDR